MLKDVCRLCLASEQVDVSIFEGETKVDLKIAACLPINVDKDDQFPKKICFDCSCKIDAFYKFWSSTALVEKKMHKLWQTDPENCTPSGIKQELLDCEEQHLQESKEAKRNLDQDSTPNAPFGTFSFHQQKVKMKKWQMMEFNGKLYYAFVPDGHEPFGNDEQPSPAKSTSPKQIEPEEVPIDEEDDDNHFDDQMETNDEDINTLTLYKSEHTDIENELECLDNYEPIVEKSPSKLIIQSTRTTNNSDSSHTYKCKVCFEVFKSTIDFKRHVAWKHKKKICVQENGTFYCTNCDYYSNIKNHFNIHLQLKHKTWSQTKRESKRSYPCTACGFVCRSKHSLQSHYIRKHTDSFEFRCEACNKDFKVKGDLTNHIRFHHREKPVECNICGKMCSNSGSLYVHQKWAHFKPKFECTICHRRMVTQENLDLHMQSQHGHRDKIMCAICGKSFTKKDSFKRHQAVHTGAKPHTCMICNRSFARRSQLRQHLLIHTGKRPFECDICGKTFTQKPGLICHRKTHPGDHPPLPVMPIGDIVKEFTEEYYAAQSQIQQIEEEGEDEDETYLSHGEEVRVEYVDS